MNEVWKQVEGYGGRYEVSNLGNVRSKFYGELSQRETPDGYLTVSLRDNKKNKRVRVHRLVAKAFVKNIYGCDVVNHKDENKKNNKSNNLEWVTAENNSKYSSCRPIRQYEVWGKPVRKWLGVTEASKELGISREGITNCCKGITRTYKGYVWKYEQENYVRGQMNKKEHKGYYKLAEP